MFTLAADAVNGVQLTPDEYYSFMNFHRKNWYHLNYFGVYNTKYLRSLAEDDYMRKILGGLGREYYKHVNLGAYINKWGGYYIKEYLNLFVSDLGISVPEDDHSIFVRRIDGGKRSFFSYYWTLSRIGRGRNRVSKIELTWTEPDDENEEIGSYLVVTDSSEFSRTRPFDYDKISPEIFFNRQALNKKIKEINDALL